MRIVVIVFCALAWILIGCESDKQNVKEISPTFYSNDKAMIGIEGQIGIVGPEFVAGRVGKYMWHFWGSDDKLGQSPFRVEAVRLDTGERSMVLIEDGGTPQEKLVWEYDQMPGGPNNGADAHIPSNLKLPSAGRWQLDASLGGEKVGAIVVNVINSSKIVE